LNGKQVDDVLNNIIGKFPGLRELDLSDIGLDPTGAFPDVVPPAWEDIELEVLDLKNNNLGALPSAAMDIWLTLYNADLSGNDMRKECPPGYEGDETTCTKCAEGKITPGGTAACTVCQEDQFSNIEGGTKCNVCPARGVTCTNDGIARLDELPDAAGATKYWRQGGADAPSFDASTKVYKCFNDEGACLLANDNRAVVCNAAKGYVKGGPVCGVCAEMSHVRIGQSCIECDMTGSAATKGIAAACTLLIVLLGATLVYAVKRRILRKLSHDKAAAKRRTDGFMERFKTAKLASKVKIIIAYFQIMTFVPVVFDIEWPPAFVDFANGLRMPIAIDFAEIFGSTSCQLATSWFAVKTSLHLGLVYIIIIMCFVTSRFVEGKLKKLEAKKDAVKISSAKGILHKIYAFVFTVLFISWPGMCVRVFQWFRCDNIEGTLYLVEDYTLPVDLRR